MGGRGARDGRWSRARSTLGRLLRPPITITDPPADAVVEWDVAIPMRDGVRLRANVFRPSGEADHDTQHPVLLCAHPYGKDDLPVHHRTRRGYRASPQYRLMRSAPVTHSAWTSWESPDPAHWVARGYVVVNADLRGWGTSEGKPAVLSAQEGLDLYDLVEWAAAQPWSTGRVGMNGVSYLAISQWAAAASRPPHLAAICPWEGFTDFYRDFARPGGVLETGFLTVWGTVTRRRSHGRVDILGPAHRRDLRDEWYADRDRDIEAIDVPALVCGSFSDHNLHSRGSFEGFRRIASPQKWLWTHRGPKWAEYYSPAALEAQARFFDHFLLGRDTGIDSRPPVRVEIREDRTTVADVRHVSSWPPADCEWQTLSLVPGTDATHGRLVGDAVTEPGSVDVSGRRGRASFLHRFATDTDVVGPMTVTLTVSVDGADDFPVVIGVRKFSGGREVTFEGSFGFQGDLVTHGLLLVSHRETDAERSVPGEPFHPHTRRRPVAAGEHAQMQVGLLPSATRFRAGDELRLDIRGRWFHGRDPVFGQFPGGYRTRASGRLTLHLGPDAGCRLTLPVWPSDRVDVDPAGGSTGG